MRRLAAGLQSALLAALLGCTFSGCDGGSAPASASGIDSQKLVRNLTDTEVRALCDWIASLSGGYGHVTTCDAGLTARAKENQQACVDSVNQTTSCTAKVQDVETCTQKRAANPCDVSILVGPDCAPVLTCG